MPAHRLLERQIAKATVDGALDVRALLSLVEAAYSEKDLDRTRADRASQLVSEELEETFAALEVQNLRFKAALNNMSQGLCLFDRQGRLAVCNQRFLEIYGIPGERAPSGVSMKDLLQGCGALKGVEALDRRLLIDEHAEIDVKNGGDLEQTWPDGRTISIVRKPVADGGYLDTVADITESRMASARIAHLARHDALTDLPNRLLLRERLLEAVRDGQRGDLCAVLCLDLDRFKQVNDTLGHPVGDALLIAVTGRLRSLVRNTDTVARLGGDEFAIIQRHLQGPTEPARLATRIIGELSRPYQIDGHEIQIGASIGIEMIGAGSRNPDEALRNADLALYKAKADGRGQYRMFEPALHALATHRRQLEIDLREGLDRGQFEVHYQSQIEVKTGIIVGFEALVRWLHPARGMISPVDFIPVTEEIGLIDRLGAFVLETACRDAMTWPSTVRVAVNLSAVQFKSRKLVSLVDRALRTAGLDPSRLELEITESVMLDDSEGVLSQLRQIKRLGVHVSLDDFGTGYSSLSYIRNFPFDNIKIDRSFVQEVGSNADSLAIIRAVAGLCSSLGMTTTAEGVETVEQLRILTEERCDNVQGYLFSKPVQLSETLALLQSKLRHQAA
jgi:diguanylate cyclase (GGDEF)-like protein